MNPTNNEQEICVSCGFCCDHTLFDIAIIQADEFVGTKFIDNEIVQDGERFFKMPCPHFKGCCSIYDGLKPKRCGEYRCNVLNRVQHAELEKTRALEIILEIRLQRDEILKEFAEITGRNASFREIAALLYTLDAENKLDASGLKLLDYKVNLLQIQLVRQFRSKEIFDDQYVIM